jgi:HEAT repeat protein
LSRIDENWSSSEEARAAVEELKSDLRNKNPQVRQNASRTLASLGQLDANEVAAAPDTEEPSAPAPEKNRKLVVSLFIATLCDTDRDLRQAAAEALGRLGDRRAESSLARALRDGDAGVRLSAEQALHSLGVVPDQC